MWPALASLGIWNWFIVGGLLLVVEVIAPGVFMFWLGLAALAVGAISLVVDWSWQAQVICLRGHRHRAHSAVAATGA